MADSPGLIDYVELGAAITKGYAATATDAGHTGSPIDASWALGHPEKVIDFGHRGIHEMTRVAKLAVQQFYGSGPKHSYFAGCSDGGREALMEAQRYPDDYDGILAGAPANYWTALLSTSVVDTQALTATPASFIPPAKDSAHLRTRYSRRATNWTVSRMAFSTIRANAISIPLRLSARLERKVTSA